MYDIIDTKFVELGIRQLETIRPKPPFEDELHEKLFVIEFNPEIEGA
jgi:hypothetical protein